MDDIATLTEHLENLVQFANERLESNEVKAEALRSAVERFMIELHSNESPVHPLKAAFFAVNQAVENMYEPGDFGGGEPNFPIDS